MVLGVVGQGVGVVLAVVRVGIDGERQGVGCLLVAAEQLLIPEKVDAGDVVVAAFDLCLESQQARTRNLEQIGFVVDGELGDEGFALAALRVGTSGRTASTARARATTAV